MSAKVEDLLESIESAVADVVDSMDATKTTAALMAIAKALEQFKTQPTVHVTPEINVQLPDKPPWNTLRITPVRDTRTGEANSYTVQRIN